MLSLFSDPENDNISGVSGVEPLRYSIEELLFMTASTLASPTKSTAVGQYLGYSLQQVRLCHHLLHVPDGDRVSLEYYDDVAVHRNNGTFLLEQDKSSLGGNPLADRSKDLWKTFANWAEQCVSGIDPNTTDFLLYVTPEKLGPVATDLHAATTKGAALAVIVKIKALVTPKNASAGCSPFITKFLNVGDEICAEIIVRFRIASEEEPLEGIRKYLRPTLPAETLDDFCAAAIGMARDMAEALIRKEQPSIVDAVRYRKRFGSFVRKHNLAGLLTSQTQPASHHAVVELLDTSPNFVRQLEVIDTTNDMLVIAVSDFLRAETDKVHWADEGLIHAESLDEFDQTLERHHLLMRDEIEDSMGAEDEMLRGRATYRKCIQAQPQLEGRTLPTHFVSGAFNCLANTFVLGWHPDYKTIFDSE